MKELEANVRSIEQDGLVWGGSKLVEVGYGIKKLQINLVVEDEKVSLEELQQRVEEDEDHVQSTDIVSIPAPTRNSRQSLTDKTGGHAEALGDHCERMVALSHNVWLLRDQPMQMNSLVHLL